MLYGRPHIDKFTLKQTLMWC